MSVYVAIYGAGWRCPDGEGHRPCPSQGGGHVRCSRCGAFLREEEDEPDSPPEQVNFEPIKYKDWLKRAEEEWPARRAAEERIAVELKRYARLLREREENG
jgi:hypothetical protein